MFEDEPRRRWSGGKAESPFVLDFEFRALLSLRVPELSPLLKLDDCYQGSKHNLSGLSEDCWLAWCPFGAHPLSMPLPSTSYRSNLASTGLSSFPLLLRHLPFSSLSPPLLSFTRSSSFLLCLRYDAGSLSLMLVPASLLLFLLNVYSTNSCHSSISSSSSSSTSSGSPALSRFLPASFRSS